MRNKKGESDMFGLLEDPFTGQPSVAFTLYAMECEGLLDPERKNEEEEEEEDECF